MKLVIDRSQWYRGKGSEYSVLLDGDGMKCCVGFHALACGVDKGHLLGTVTVIYGTLQASKYPWTVQRFDVNDDTPLDIQELYWLNDHILGEKNSEGPDKYNFLPPTTEKERENRIAAIFLKHDVEVEYIN